MLGGLFWVVFIRDNDKGNLMDNIVLVKVGGFWCEKFCCIVGNCFLVVSFI